MADNAISLSNISGTTTAGRYVVHIRGDVATARGLAILTDWRDGTVDAACRIEDIDDAPRCERCGCPDEDLTDCECDGEHMALCMECEAWADGGAEERDYGADDRRVDDCDVREPMCGDDLGQWGAE